MMGRIRRSQLPPMSPLHRSAKDRQASSVPSELRSDNIPEIVDMLHFFYDFLKPNFFEMWDQPELGTG